MTDPTHWININLVIFLGISLVALALLGIFVLIGMKIMKGGGSKQRKVNQDDESRLIQEIYHGLSRMEGRVEALETLLLDREKGERRP